jgi:hypothetical protein
MQDVLLCTSFNRLSVENALTRPARYCCMQTGFEKRAAVVANKLLCAQVMTTSVVSQ